MFARVAVGVAAVTFVAAVAFTVAAIDAPAPSRVASRPTASPLPTADPRVVREAAASVAGYKRITSPLGGWSMEIPAAWHATAARVRGAEIATFDVSAAQLSGNAPATDQLRMSVTLEPVQGGRTLEQVGMDGVPAFLLVDQTRITVAGLAAVRTTHRAYEPAGSPFDLLHVRWTLRSPNFRDRVMAIDVWPADGALRGAGDRAVASLQFVAPLSLPVQPGISRAEAIAKSELTGHRIDRESAKLASYREYIEATNATAPPDGPRLWLGPDPDPDDLVWIVVIAGDLGPMPRGGPPGPGIPAAAPATTRWIMSVLNASDGAQRSGTWSPNGEWPAWFDTLKDRAP